MKMRSILTFPFPLLQYDFYDSQSEKADNLSDPGNLFITIPIV